MAAKSRVAQEKLADLEIHSAPFEEQLLEAAKFIGIDLDEFSGSSANGWDLEGECLSLLYHGREEWLLRWLLKRLADQKDDAPRHTTNSWVLLRYLLRVIPPSNAAQMLNERKFTTILRQALEELIKTAGSRATAQANSDIGSKKRDKSLRVSKKRKRSGELVVKSSPTWFQQLPAAIFAAVYQILRLTEIAPSTLDDGRSNGFSTEYMKSVIKTTAEDAAKILGAWLALCQISSKEDDFVAAEVMLAPFIKIWEYRAIGDEDLMHFSLHCSGPLLLLLKFAKSKTFTTKVWLNDLEQLAARNIMIPAKIIKLANPDSDLLGTLTRIFVIQDSANASILFEIAIRSIQSQGSRRRRQNDEAWLETVFTVLKDAMPPQRVDANSNALREMLQSAIKYKVILQLSVISSVTLDYCFLESSTNWELLATIIQFDPNVFLILQDDQDLAQQALNRITGAWLDSEWSDISHRVVSGVLVPLMHGFAKARDLSTFIHHWHRQIVESVKLREKNLLSPSVKLLNAWEDEALQGDFFTLMEASLTVTQISELLDWLLMQAMESPEATCIILDAVAGSIGREEVADAVGLRLIDIMCHNGVSEKLDDRHRWRSWRILSRTLRWINQSGVQEISVRWDGKITPFDRLSVIEHGDISGSDSSLASLEALRCACAAWNVSVRGTRIEYLARTSVLSFFHSLSQGIKVLLQRVLNDGHLGEDNCSSPLKTVHRGFGWIIWASISCVFVEFPRVIGLGVELHRSEFRELLQTYFWLSSLPQDSPPAGVSPWLRNNATAFSKVWTSLLNSDAVHKDPAFTALIIDVMLCNVKNEANPLVNTPTANSFAIHCLLLLPSQLFSRNDRERVMVNWLPIQDDTISELAGSPISLDDAVLSLKVKVLERSLLHEGTEYQDLISLADALAAKENDSLDISLYFFKELARRILSHITANLDQPRNREYILCASSHFQKKVKTKVNDNEAPKMNFARIALFEVLFEVVTARGAQLNDLDIITDSDLSEMKGSFQKGLLAQLEHLLPKLKGSSGSSKRAGRSVLLCSIINALSVTEVNTRTIGKVVAEAKKFSASLSERDAGLLRRLEWLLPVSADEQTGEIQLGGDVSTVDGRKVLAKRIFEYCSSKDPGQNLTMIRSSLESNSGLSLDKLWAVRHMIISCEDSRKVPTQDDEVTIDLSSIYSLLRRHLLHATSFREFSLVSETLVLMLRTKGRSMTQWNVDSTLGDLAIMCSRNGPKFRADRAGSIYIHLCQLLQTLLTSHRLKLEGHFHLVVQAMQSLLRCLFTPLPHSTSKISKIFAPPPWLSSPEHQLKAKHAAAFTRLVTLICDPSVSSVTRSKHNNLTSATDRAKRMAGQHMQFVLTLYVQLQLEMKMLPEVREKMGPGLHAIFDTTTPEMRRMISDGLDSSGRAVFAMLFKDYQRFGKWKGS